MARQPARALAAALDQLRLSRGLTRSELARELDVDPSQVGRWLKGDNVPTIDNIAVIARFFGVDRDTLERLAGYRANTIASMHDSMAGTINPHVAAMLDAERSELRDELHGIPPVFWPSILTAQRTARKLAVDNARAAMQIAGQDTVSTDAMDELTPLPDHSPRDGAPVPPPNAGSLTENLLLAGVG